jgi:hypothetical protein
MKSTIIAVAVLALTFTFVGCIRGQFAGHRLDPNQVKMITGANGATEYHLILPIKGKPFGCGAQWIFDQLVDAQAGGDIQSITVDPATVQVTFSHQQWGEGMFIFTGEARITLTQGKGEIEGIWFREPMDGGCGEDRIFSTYGWAYIPEVTAYREGLASWTTASNTPNSTHQAEAIEAQLSIEMLVSEITSDGTVKMAALEDWERANQIAWSKRGLLGLQ